MAKPALRTRHDRRADKAEPQAAAPPAPSTPAPAGFAELAWAEIAADPLNPRKHFDDDELNELAASILRDGLLENLVVRPPAVSSEPWRLVAGERRWRAIGKLIERGQWERPIMCKVVDLDEAGARRVALVENLQRKDLRPIDEARALQALMALEDIGTAEVALEIGFTQRFVQQRLQLLELPEPMQDQVNAGELPIEQARAAVALLPKLPPIKQVELREGSISVEDARVWLERQPKVPELTPAQWSMALEIYDAVLRRPMKKSAYEYERTEVGYAARDDGHLEQLVTRGLYRGPNDQQDKHYEKTGRIYVCLDYRTRDHLDLKFGEDYRAGGQALQDALAEARKAAELSTDLAPGIYQTSWLNGPFEVPKEIAEKYAATLAKRKKAEAAEKARREQAQTAADDRKAKADTNAEVVQAILQDLAGRPPTPCNPRFAEALSAAGLPAPWTMAERARVVAADGQEVLHAIWYLDEQPWVAAQRALIVVAVNLAAGVDIATETPGDRLETPHDEGRPDELPPETPVEEADSEIPEYLRRLAGGAAETPAEAL